MRFNYPFFFNKLMVFAGTFEHKKYFLYSNKVEKTQQQKLLKYLYTNKNTSYGRLHNFKNIKTYEEYIQNVPLIHNWQQIQNHIEEISDGHPSILYTEKTTAFEETSGSTAPSKLIPITKGLRKEFQNAIKVWMLELYNLYPDAFKGKAYWSISPVLKPVKFTKGNKRIGSLDDSEYFNPLIAKLLSKTIAVNNNVLKITNSQTFYSETLKQLLLNSNLTLISVWSPSFFLQMDKHLRDNWVVIINLLKDKDYDRYQYLLPHSPENFNWKQLWPNLACLSCWTDAQASMWLTQVKNKLGNVPIQPKGLLATEAIISIPLSKTLNSALAYRSHFFEFKSTRTQQIFLAHQLIINDTYEVIVTTAGGLYRYCTKDIVKITGFHNSIPIMLFLGRSNRNSDMVGEKLSETMVNNKLSNYLEKTNVNFSMLFLKAVNSPSSAGYILYTSAENNPKTDMNDLIHNIEISLKENPYYLQAINTGQLQPLKHKFLKDNFKQHITKYYREKNLIKDGDIKFPALFMADELIELSDYL